MNAIISEFKAMVYIPYFESQWASHRSLLRSASHTDLIIVCKGGHQVDFTLAAAQLLQLGASSPSNASRALSFLGRPALFSGVFHHIVASGLQANLLFTFFLFLGG